MAHLPPEEYSLLLAAVRDAGTISGNPWHDPKTGRFANAPPGFRMLHGGHLFQAITDKAGVQELISNTPGNGIAAYRIKPGIAEIHVFNGTHLVNKGWVELDEKKLARLSRTRARSLSGAPGAPDVNMVIKNDQGEDVHVTSDVEEAVRLLGEGKKVELHSVDQVAVLLDKIANIAQDAKRKGENAPNYDLCHVTVKGTNIFCVESKGIPRIRMPQLKGTPAPGSKADVMARDPNSDLEYDSRDEVELTGKFIEWLGDQGIIVHNDTALASHLKASQNELNGIKTAGIMKFLDGGGVLDAPFPMLVSHDNYVVDGHHRWAATIGHDLGTSGSHKPGEFDITMDVARVEADIIDLLELANRFAAEWGIPQSSAANTAKDLANAGPKSPVATHDRLPSDPFFDEIVNDKLSQANALASVTGLDQQFVAETLAAWTGSNSKEASKRNNDLIDAARAELLGENVNADPDLRRLARAIHDATQARLGSGSTTLYRGINSHRGEKQTSWNDQGLTSFADNKQSAAAFGSPIAVTVPNNQIFSIPEAGIGNEYEHEVVVLGRQPVPDHRVDNSEIARNYVAESAETINRAVDSREQHGGMDTAVQHAIASGTSGSVYRGEAVKQIRTRPQDGAVLIELRDGSRKWVSPKSLKEPGVDQTLQPRRKGRAAEPGPNGEVDYDTLAQAWNEIRGARGTAEAKLLKMGREYKRAIGSRGKLAGVKEEQGEFAGVAHWDNWLGFSPRVMADLKRWLDSPPVGSGDIPIPDADFDGFRTFMHEVQHTNVRSRWRARYEYRDRTGRALEEGMVETLARYRSSKLSGMSTAFGAYYEEVRWVSQSFVAPYIQQHVANSMGAEFHSGPVLQEMDERGPLWHAARDAAMQALTAAHGDEYGTPRRLKHMQRSLRAIGHEGFNEYQLLDLGGISDGEIARARLNGDERRVKRLSGRVIKNILREGR